MPDMAGRTITYHQGAWHDGNPPMLGPMVHSLWMGSAVFDGARAFSGLAPDLARHCARVVASAQSFGMTPEITADGIEALAYIDDSPSPDVMLVDINMPKMGGAELLRHLAERNYPGAIILVSGTDKDTITVAEGLANYRGLKVLGHIAKPMTPNALSSLLAKLE